MTDIDRIMLGAIELSDGRERFFTDLDLSQGTHVSRDTLNRFIEDDKQLSVFLEKMKKK